MNNNYGSFNYKVTYLSEQEIRAQLLTKKKINWAFISSCPGLSDEFLETYKKKLHWNIIACRQELTIDQIRKYANLLDWDFVLRFQKVINKEEYYREFSNFINWNNFKIPNLSQNFYREFQNKINWDSYIYFPQKFIEEMQDKVNWKLLSQSNYLTEEFIEKYTQKVNWRIIFFSHKNLSQKFKDKNYFKVWLTKGTV